MSRPLLGPSLQRQLSSNQLWETVAFAAKAVFMLGLTPWMLHAWGATGYGEFAIASSFFVLLSLCDLGLRGRTRIELAKAVARGDSSPALAESLLLFAVISGLILASVVSLTFWHGWSKLLAIPRKHEWLFVVVTALTLPYLATSILLEAIVLHEGVGRIKMAGAGGWVAAIPAVALALSWHSSVPITVTIWIAALLCANIALTLHRLHYFALPQHLGLRAVTWSGLRSALKQSHWMNITSITWASKSHGLILLTGALGSPAAAGSFFILLRMSEIISALGAVSFDVGLAVLPRCRSARERRECLRTVCVYALAFSIPSAAAIALGVSPFFRYWLAIPTPLGWSTGLWTAALGLAIASNRLVTYCALGLGVGRTAALCGGIEVCITLLGVYWLQSSYGLIGTFLPPTLAVCAYLPAVIAIRKAVAVPTPRANDPALCSALART